MPSETLYGLDVKRMEEVSSLHLQQRAETEQIRKLRRFLLKCDKV